MIYKIYGLFDLTDNKCIYIGKTKRDLDKRYDEHLNDVKHPDKASYLKNNFCDISYYLR